MMLHKCILFTIIVFLCYGCVAQHNRPHVQYRILLYGLQNESRENALFIISKKWNIEYRQMGECLVGIRLIDSIKKENAKVFKLIKTRYGKNWEDRFDAEVGKEFLIEKGIDSLVNSQQYILNKEIVNPRPDTFFSMVPLPNSPYYIVDINTYSSDWAMQKLYQLKVDYKRKIVEIIKDYTENN